MNRLTRTGAALVDSGPVLVLAGIAGTGSFAHIRDTATEHGQSGPMAWAVAVCIDLTCVMAARERQRDRRTGRPTRLVTWPTLVLAGGILLSLAANLAQAEPTWWGRITAATPCGAFLVAVSMLERRSTDHTPQNEPQDEAQDEDVPAPETVPTDAPQDVPVRQIVPEDVPADVPDISNRPADDSAVPVDVSNRPGDVSARRVDVLTVPAVPDSPAPSSPSASAEASGSGAPAEALLAFARRVANEHHTQHGKPITRDALRSRLGVSNQLASDLLHQIRS